MTSVVPVDAQLVISEFRVRGPNGANDEFIEIYNNSGADHTVAARGPATASRPRTGRRAASSRTDSHSEPRPLPLREQRRLFAGVYPAGNGTTPPATPPTRPTFRTTPASRSSTTTAAAATSSLANRLDAVGSTSEANTLYKEGTGYPALTPFSIDYSFYRDECGKSGIDHHLRRVPDQHAQGHRQQRRGFHLRRHQRHVGRRGPALGAPGPENSRRRSSATPSFAIDLLDSCVGSAPPPNRVRDFTSDPANNSTFGTLDHSPDASRTTRAATSRGCVSASST